MSVSAGLAWKTAVIISDAHRVISVCKDAVSPIPVATSNATLVSTVTRVSVTNLVLQSPVLRANDVSRDNV